MSRLADKVVEKVVVTRLFDHLYIVMDQRRSCNLPTRRVIVLPKVHDDVSRALGSGMGILMLYLDLSAASDTLNTGQLLRTLETSCAALDTGDVKK